MYLLKQEYELITLIIGLNQRSILFIFSLLILIVIPIKFYNFVPPILLPSYLQLDFIILLYLPFIPGINLVASPNYFIHSVKRFIKKYMHFN